MPKNDAELWARPMAGDADAAMQWLHKHDPKRWPWVPKNKPRAEFVKRIKERIEIHGHLPQREWHMKKLFAKVRSVLAEHGRVQSPSSGHKNLCSQLGF
jgi:hypothetical protein